MEEAPGAVCRNQCGRTPGLKHWSSPNNDLTDEVPEQIDRLRRLRMLDLGHNALTRVPDALGNLSWLLEH